MQKTIQKINDRMDAVQHHMESNTHLKDPYIVVEAIESVSKFWSVLSDEDRDYLQVASDAVAEGREWRVQK